MEIEQKKTPSYTIIVVPTMWLTKFNFFFFIYNISLQTLNLISYFAFKILTTIFAFYARNVLALHRKNIMYGTPK